MRQLALAAGITVAVAAAAAPLTAAAQTPSAPYQEEDVSFTNGDIKLAGTLTLPSPGQPRAAVVLLTGSGAQNRDEELFGFRPFKVIADHFGRAGIAVLRYDDRGVGGSTGSVVESTTRAFADDALAAVGWLKARLGAPTRIGLLGHSEGAIAAAMAAATAPNEIAFIIMMAGTGERGDAVLRRQAEDLSRLTGGSDETIARILAAHRKMTDAIAGGADRATTLDAVRALVRAQLELQPGMQSKAPADLEAFVNKLAEANAPGILSPWFRFFVALDPAESLAKVGCPVLVLFGERDLQVPPAANRRPIEAALAAAKNQDVTVKVYPEANHLFIKSVTGSPAEYPKLEKVFVPGFLDDVSTWLLSRAKR
jgi:pimeloyl-ACP methyl ester carboxylesterase